jgi:FKBP-type peptidyl-prolyl cis-trans isomerase
MRKENGHSGARKHSIAIRLPENIFLAEVIIMHRVEEVRIHWNKMSSNLNRHSKNLHLYNNNKKIKKTTLLLSALSILMLNACTNVGFEKTKSGLEYKILKKGSGEKLEHGDFVKFQYRLTYKDSSVMNSYDFMPVYDQVDSVGRFHDFSEFLTKMKVGDSAVCYQFFDTLQKSSQYGVPPYMKKGDKQQITIKIISVFKNKDGKASRDFAVDDYKAEIDRYKVKEMAAIEKYLSLKSIKADKVNNSVYVQIEQQGTGKQADSGQLVGVRYNGYSFEGKYFDSNIDTAKQFSPHGLDTFFFVSKQEGAIQGMLEGITVFKKGGKGKMFIPSSMAYGPQGSPPAIMPNQNLIFDIEVVEVKDLPKAPQGAMPPPPPPAK